MKISEEFLSQVLDSITEHIVVIDERGDIGFVNRSWTEFAIVNSSALGDTWEGQNYLVECDKAAAMGDPYGGCAASGIRSVIDGDKAAFYFEYPCHGPQEKRWFMMRVTPLAANGSKYFVISHQNITERKLAEEEAASLARLDGLTGIANRRAFDESLAAEWKRCARLRKHLSLAIVDIDHFKLLNDTYGHQVGDECLVRVGAVLREFARRPGDVCARYGGEEFAMIWGDTSPEQSQILAAGLLDAIAGLRIPNRNAPAKDTMTVSIGLAVIAPTMRAGEAELVELADRLLYRAKANGRNRVESDACDA